MSAFLDEVLAAQDTPRHPPRRTGEGLSGSSKRFATLLTLMVGLTAVPTFIMVRAGVEELRSSTAIPVRPIVLGVPDKPPPSNSQPPVIEPQQSWSLPIIPPEPVVPQRDPILERKAVVDTSPRPVAKGHKTAKQPAQAPAQPSTSEDPVNEPRVPRKARKHKHHVRRPQVERPEKPDVVRPYRDRTDRPRS